MTWAIGDALGGACFLLVDIPIVETALGIIVTGLAGLKAISPGGSAASRRVRPVLHLVNAA
jgi:hypothetical protein